MQKNVDTVTNGQLFVPNSLQANGPLVFKRLAGWSQLLKNKKTTGQSLTVSNDSAVRLICANYTRTHTSLFVFSNATIRIL